MVATEWKIETIEPLVVPKTCIVHWRRFGSILNFKIEKECQFITTESALRHFAELRGLKLSDSEQLEPQGRITVKQKTNN